MMSGLGAATDFTVDQDFETTGDNEFTSIQAAVDAAESGDTIEVTSGTYDESVTITTSEVTLTNASGELPKLEMPSDSEKGFTSERSQLKFQTSSLKEKDSMQKNYLVQQA